MLRVGSTDSELEIRYTKKVISTQRVAGDKGKRDHDLFLSKRRAHMVRRKLTPTLRRQDFAVSKLR
jgi:hypothetical protein